MAFTPPIPLVPYWDFHPGAPIVPKLYWDAVSPEQGVHRLAQELRKLCEYANAIATSVNLDHKIIEELQDAFEKFVESGFDDYYAKQIQAWIDAHLADIIGAAAKMVFFGLTDDGYFCAYIPDSWNEITFDTGMVYGRSDYGRLILRFDADGKGVIDNTYSYSLNSKPSDFRQLVADLEANANRTDQAYDALFTNLDEVISNGNF